VLNLALLRTFGLLDLFCSFYKKVKRESKDRFNKQTAFMSRRTAGGSKRPVKHSTDEYDEYDDDSNDAGKRKQRRRFIWSDDLHRDFISAGCRKNMRS